MSWPTKVADGAKKAYAYVKAELARLSPEAKAKAIKSAAAAVVAAGGAGALVQAKMVDSDTIESMNPEDVEGLLTALVDDDSPSEAQMQAIVQLFGATHGADGKVSGEDSNAGSVEDALADADAIRRALSILGTNRVSDLFALMTVIQMDVDRFVRAQPLLVRAGVRP